MRPLRVRTGLSDGAMTEVSGGEIKEGMEVVVAEQRPEAPKGGTTNPFTPQFMKANK